VADLSTELRQGLFSFVDKNQDNVTDALGVSGKSVEELVGLLVDVLGVNRLSVEQLLARFFSKEVLSEYAENVLGKSGKGSESTLADRIGREWRRKNPAKRTKEQGTIVATKKTKKDESSINEKSQINVINESEACEKEVFQNVNSN